MLKIAVVGTGIIAKSHIDAINELDSFKLVAVCDVNEQKAKAYSEEYNVPYFLNYKDIPARVECDAVILNLPHCLHCEASVFFLEAGIHVLCEKPMANTIEECDKIIEASVKNNKKFVVGHVMRYVAGNKYVKDIYESGELGKLVMYTENRTINYFQDSRPGWFFNKKLAGGGIMMNYGAHTFDRLFSIMEGASITSISSSCGNVKNDYDVEGHAQFLAQFDNGVSAAVTFSGYASQTYDCYFYFTNGAIHITPTYVKIDRDDGKGFVTVDVTSEIFVEQLLAFRERVMDRESASPDGKHGRKIIEAIQKIYGDNNI